MVKNNTVHLFDTRSELADALAATIAGQLQAAIDKDGAASIAVSGGSTPKLLFDKLSRQPIKWDSVTITLVDERCVPADHERSNARLVLHNLHQNKAANARFIALHSDGHDPKAIALKQMELQPHLPFTTVILGMGTDGHTASFFPDAVDLSIATDPATETILTSVTAPAAVEPRLTLTLPVLLSAECLLLHIEGEEKKVVLDQARKSGPADELPIRHILQNRPDLEVYWAK